MSTKFNELFQSIDKSDTEAFLSFLSRDASFIFGNLEPVKGKDNIRNFLNNFFESIDHTEHSQIEEYKTDNTWFTTGKVKYTRKDGTHLSVPFCNKFEMNDSNEIEKYEIFVDNSELYK